MDREWLPQWLRTPGVHRLPSGRDVLVEPIEETWICIDLGERLVAIVDLDEEPPIVAVSLQWPYGIRSELNPPGTRPYGYEATVALLDGRLVVRELPVGEHRRNCGDGWTPPCSIGDAAEFYAHVHAGGLESCIDVLAGLGRDVAGWEVPDDGVLLWRGLADEQGRALVERLPRDDTAWEGRVFDIAARLPVGLRPLDP